MAAITQLLVSLGIFTFVTTNSAALGLSLTVGQIVAPLRSRRLLAVALLANFVLIPVLALLLQQLIPLDEGFATGLLLIATAAGAPFLPKLVQVAQGAVAMSVGVMGLLMGTTIIYMPVVLPLLLPGVRVNPLDIATPLILLMLIPLAIGLFVKARRGPLAAKLRPVFAQIANIGLAVGAVALVVRNAGALVAALGNGAFLAAFLLIVSAFLSGWFLAGNDRNRRTVLSLGTAQRNMSAALVVAQSNFADPNVTVMCMVGGILMLVGLLLTARILARRA